MTNSEDPDQLASTLFTKAWDIWFQQDKVSVISYRELSFNLYHSMGIFSRWQIDDIILIFCQKIGFDILKTIYMKCQCLFSEKEIK